MVAGSVWGEMVCVCVCVCTSSWTGGEPTFHILPVNLAELAVLTGLLSCGTPVV